MRPELIPGTSAILGEDDAAYIGLPVRMEVIRLEDGRLCYAMRSMWILSDEDRALIAAGAPPAIDSGA